MTNLLRKIDSKVVFNIPLFKTFDTNIKKFKSFINRLKNFNKIYLQSFQCSVLECRNYSARKGFFSSIIENIKEDIAKNKEMKENIKKFREEAQKLENSEALQAARKKFHAVESEASKSSEVLKETLEGIKGRVGHVLEEASKTDIVKKAGKFTIKLYLTIFYPHFIILKN